MSSSPLRRHAPRADRRGHFGEDLQSPSQGAKEIREVDTLIQRTNWEIDLIED